MFPFLFLSFPDFSDFPTFSGCVQPPQNCFPSSSSHFRIFPTFSDLFRMRPTVTKWLPFLFLSCPDFSGFFPDFPDFSEHPSHNCSFSRPCRVISGFFRSYPDESSHDKIVALPVPLISGFSDVSDFSGFSNVFRMRSTATKLFPLLFLSFPYFPDFAEFLRRFPDAIDRLQIIVPLHAPLISGFFQSFPDLSDFFQLVPDASDRHKIVPLPIPLISRVFPDFSASFQLLKRPTATKLFPFLFLSLAGFLVFSDAFRMGPTVTKLFPFLFLSCLDFPDFSDFFRLVSDASDRHKIVPLPVPLISGFFRIFPDFSGFSDFADMFRMRPVATKLTGPFVV